jgi:hypothetical protein
MRRTLRGLQNEGMSNSEQSSVFVSITLRTENKRINMRTLILVCSVLFLSPLIAVPAQCQENTSSSQPADQNAVEGTVVSSTRNTLVVRTDDNQYQLFTYGRGAVRPAPLAPGARARVAFNHR